MTKIFTYVIILSAFIATFIAASNIFSTVYAQSTGITNTGCPPGSPKGTICITPQEYKLPVGKWSAFIGVVSGPLTVSSVDNMGKVHGTIGLGGSLCKVQPCLIDGSFDRRSGKIIFSSSPAVPTLVAQIQNYTGYLSQNVRGIDVVDYTLTGIGKDIKPVPGPEFRWYATISCLVTGPCLGLAR
jgi:hypothetical protein